MKGRRRKNVNRHMKNAWKKLAWLLIALFLILGGYFVYERNSNKTYLNEPQVREENRDELPKEEPENVPLGIYFTPENVVQGEPVLISVKGLPTSTTVKSMTFNGRKLVVFDYKGNPSAVMGIDLRQVATGFSIEAILSDGRRLSKILVVNEREKITGDFGIPDKLGGNTTEAERELINTLVEEANIMNSLPTANTKLWEESFRPPLNPPLEITDIYGYSRSTGGSTLSHKGTDFRATIGTSVYAMNSGRVVFNDFLRNYGNTIVIDHGLGLHTVYMHLSESFVEKDQDVEKGLIIGKTGDTGYVLGPHLHLSVRIYKISIDPVTFLEVFGE